MGFAQRTLTERHHTAYEDHHLHLALVGLVGRRCRYYGARNVGPIPFFEIPTVQVAAGEAPV